MRTYLLSSTVSEFSHSKCHKSLYITTPLRLNPPTEEFPWDDLRKVFRECQWMAKVSYGEKQDQKAPRTIALLNDSFGNRRFYFELQFQVDGDVARNRSMDRWIGEWCSYNFAAGSFHTKKLCSRLFSREVEFYWHKQRYRVFVQPFGDLWVTYTVHLWLVEKRVGRLSLFERGWVTLNANFRGKGASPPTNFGVRKLESLGYRMAKKNCQKFQPAE